MEVPAAYWIGFIVGVVVLLAIDLGLFNRKNHQVVFKEAALWSGFCVLLALLLNGFLWYEYGNAPAIQFLTGYLVELSLSVDNLFVFAVLFRYFHVPAKYQHRVLFWGIFGAIVMRALMIFIGVALVNRFSWLLPVFGLFLLVTGVRMLRTSHDEEPEELESKGLLRLLRRVLPVTPVYHGQRFIIKLDGRWMATPLLMVLIMIEMTDVLFALDSIPAILGITQETFLIFSSNIMAIIGLRAMYFLLASIIEKFRYLHYGLSVVLIFIGGKMIAELFHVEIPIVGSLLFIAGVLFLSVLPTLVTNRREALRARRALDPSAAEPPPTNGKHPGAALDELDELRPGRDRPQAG